MKYSLLFIISTIFFLTVLCISGKGDQEQPTAIENFSKELIHHLKTLATDLTDISGSSNVFVKIIREITDSMIEKYDKDKKEIKLAVTKGIEMEKKIQSLLQSLKNSSVPLTKELQAEVDAIGKHATSELTKLKEMENDKDIEGIEREAKTKHADIKVKIQELFKKTLTMFSNTEKTSENTNTTQITIEFKAILRDLKTKVIAIIYESVPVALAGKKNDEIISNKMTTTYTTLSKIRNDLVRMEKIQFNLLSGYKDYFGTDAASLTRSLLRPCVFAILIGMIF